MKAFNKVIFVDEENTRLGPFAGVLFEERARQAGLDIQTESRGLVVLFPEPANQKIAKIAASLGLSLENHKAEALCTQDFSQENLVLALDEITKKRIFETFATPANVFTLREYVGEIGSVIFPIGEPMEKYEAVCDTVSRLMDALINKLREDEGE